MPTYRKDLQERNNKIVKAYKQRYFQHMIAKASGLLQLAIYGVIKRSRK